jgi:MscS family membrane protein
MWIGNGNDRSSGGTWAGSVAAASVASASLTWPSFAQAASAEPAQEVNSWAAQALPEYFVTLQFWEISLWQWIALLFLICVAYAAGFFVARLLVRCLTSLTQRTVTPWDDLLVERAAAPMRLAASLAIFYFGTLTLGLSPSGEAAMAVFAQVVAVFAAAWLAMRLVDLFAAFADQKLDVRGDAGAKTLVPMGRRIAKVFLLAIAALSLLQNLGFNITSLLAGLGIGGLAVALAAQKTLENVFGGMMVVLDRPVKIGDFCKVGEHMGTVEDIGMRASLLRTLDQTVVSIPNSEFSTVRIENFAGRRRMRLATVLQVGYDTTPDQMRYLLIELKRLLHAHPKVLSAPLRVRLVNFGQHSLDIELFAYIGTGDYDEFTAVREDLFLRIMDIVAASGAYFAYPSQTLYLARDGGRDLAKSAMAEAAVEGQRAEGRLPMPEFPQGLIDEIDGSIAYPPEGSAQRAAAG